MSNNLFIKKMPPKKIDKQSMKCLKFGEILLNENRKVIFLCAYCMDFMEIDNFMGHLQNCGRVKHIFKSQTLSKLKCDTDETKLLTKVTKDAKELLVYGFDNSYNATGTHDSKNGDLSDFLGIEEELLNPKWYTDTTSSGANGKNDASYNELIEEVTPFVQFKENVKTNISPARVTRESLKQTTKYSSKPIVNETLIKKEPTTKLFLSDDKKQVLRRAIAEKPKSIESSQKPIQQQMTTIAQNMKNVINKPLLRYPSKIVVQDTTKVAIKRKTDSLPTSKAANSSNKDEHQTIKRRKSLAHELQTSLELKQIATTASNLKEANPKSTSLVKNTHISSSVVLPIQEKQEKIILNAKLPVPLRRGRSEINNLQKQQQQQVSPTSIGSTSQRESGSLTSSGTKPDKPVLLNKVQQQEQQTLQQQQVKLQTNPHRIQQTNSLVKGSSNQSVKTNSAIQTQIKEKSQTIQRSAQSLPIIIERKVSSTHSIQPQQTTTSSLTNNNQKTAEILNKLQTLGLKVQRTNPQPEPNTKISSTGSKSNEKALEIIKKLQSKGMNVKIVQKPKTTSTKEPLAFTTIYSPKALTQEDIGKNIKTSLSFSVPKHTTTVDNSGLATKTNFRKNVLIKKCN